MKMTRYRKIQWFTPLILFLGLILDAASPAVFPLAFLGNGQTIVSHIVLFYIVTIAFYFRDSNIMITACLFGLVTDSYTTTLLGIYAAMYAIVVYLVIKTKRFFPKKAIIHWMMFIVAITLVDFLVFVFYKETGQTAVVLTHFLVNRLAPTLIYNTVLMFVLYFPTKSLLHWLGYEEHVIF